MTHSLFLVADDLTGANDTSVNFAQAGFRTLLALSPQTLTQTLKNTADVYAVSTDSRPRPAIAAEKTSKATQAAIQEGVSKLYLKIDSTMRGSVAQQIEGAISAWQEKYPNASAIICPAYPAMGRSIENGQLLVHGLPVNETPSGKDVICPVPTADMAKLLPQAQCLSITSAADLIGKIQKYSDKRQFVIDAKTEADMDIIAQALEKLGPAFIPVGSAGLAQAIVKTLASPSQETHQDPLPLKDPVLLVVTSIHDTSQTQVDNYIGSENGANSIVFSPHPAQLIANNSLAALTAQMQALLVSGDGCVIIRANPAKFDNGMTREALAKTFARQLANLGKTSLIRRRFGALVLFGGDGSAALLETLGVHTLQVLRPIAEGVPLAIICGGRYDGLAVITKSGGFGAPDLLCRMMEQLSPKE